MAIFSTISTRNNIYFFDIDTNITGTRLKCRNNPLFVQWKNIRNSSTEYKNILTQCKISWGKFVNMRSAVIEYASSEGE